jgi:hypothetical protein
VHEPAAADYLCQIAANNRFVPQYCLASLQNDDDDDEEEKEPHLNGLEFHLGVCLFRVVDWGR